jgi:hypothetical protein
MTTPNDLVERALEAFAHASGLGILPDEDEEWREDLMNGMSAAIAIALEEAARVAEIYEYDELEDDGGATIKPSAAIRAMMEKKND